MVIDLTVLENQLIHARAIDAGMVWRAQSGGRTNQVWHLAGETDLVVKLYDPSNDNPLYANSPQSEYDCLLALAGKDIAPHVRALVNTDAGQVLVYEYLNGTNWSKDVASVAHLLERIWAVPPVQGLRQSSNGSSELIEQTNKIIQELPKSTAQTYAEAQPTNIELAPAKAVLIHTDVVAGNMIDTAQGLRMIDWQCPAIGDPATDIAMFLSPAMQLTYGIGRLRDDQIDRFLASFQDRELVCRYQQLAPLFHWRMAAYCAWRADRGDTGYADAAVAELMMLT